MLNNALELTSNINNTAEQSYAYRALSQAEKLLNNINESLNYPEAETSLTNLIQKEREESESVREKVNSDSFEMEMELFIAYREYRA